MLFDAAAAHIQLRNFSTDVILEHKLRRAATGPESLSGFAASVASGDPVPGGGSVCALAGQLGAALAQMVAGLTIGRKKYAAVDGEMKAIASEAAALAHELSALVQRDSAAYTLVSNAYKMPKDSPENVVARDAAIQRALMTATEVPLETARAAASVAALAARCAAKGNTNAASDAGVAALLADAACKGAAYNVRINVASMNDKSVGAGFAAEAKQLAAKAGGSVAEALFIVEQQIG